MPGNRAIALKKWEQKIDEKVRKQRQIADLEEKLIRVIELQREQAEAFRATLDDVHADFQRLKDRVAELEGKSGLDTE